MGSKPSELERRGRAFAPAPIVDLGAFRPARAARNPSGELFCGSIPVGISVADFFSRGCRFGLGRIAVRPRTTARSRSRCKLPPARQRLSECSALLGRVLGTGQSLRSNQTDSELEGVIWVQSSSHRFATAVSAFSCLLLLGTETFFPSAALAGGLKNAHNGPDGIVYYEIVTGKGRSIQCGDRVAAHIDVFAKGIEVDTTRDGQGLAARPKAWDLCTEGVGPGAALRGLDLGVRGMRVGGKRVIDVPPELAYGSRGHGPLIPPNTPLRIKVTLLSAKKWGSNPNVSPPGSSVF